MPEIQAFCLYLICLTSQQEMLLIGHTPQSILLCTQMVPKRSGHSLPEIHRLSSKNSFWNLPWIPGLHLLSLLTTKSMNIDLEVEVHPTSHPVWILTSPEASTSSHPVLSNKKVILLGKDAGERGERASHVSIASWSNEPCSVTKLCLTLSNPMDCSTPGFLVLHYLPEFAQIHVHWDGDAIQPSDSLQPLLLLPSIFPSIRVFSNESVLLRIRWPKYCIFSFSIRPSNEYSRLISWLSSKCSCKALWVVIRVIISNFSKLDKSSFWNKLYRCWKKNSFYSFFLFFKMACLPWLEEWR